MELDNDSVCSECHHQLYQEWPFDGLQMANEREANLRKLGGQPQKGKRGTQLQKEAAWQTGNQQN